MLKIKKRHVSQNEESFYWRNLDNLINLHFVIAPCNQAPKVHNINSGLKGISQNNYLSGNEKKRLMSVKTFLFFTDNNTEGKKKYKNKIF